MNALEIKDIHKVFNGKREVRAVDGVSLSVESDGIFGLLGVNGAGKTTLIRMLCGLMAPTSGDATVLGKSILTDMAEIKKEIAVSPQETSVAPNLTVRENLMFIASVYGMDKAAARECAERIISTMKLDEVADRRARTLSGGWQRRLSIAITLVSDPKIIFLDEPTLGLDVLARRELWRLIESLKGKCTIVLTSHYLEEIEHLCDRVAILVKGKVLALGTVDEIKQSVGETSFEEAFVKIVDGPVDEGGAK